MALGSLFHPYLCKMTIQFYQFEPAGITLPEPAAKTDQLHFAVSLHQP